MEWNLKNNLILLVVLAGAVLLTDYIAYLTHPDPEIIEVVGAPKERAVVIYLRYNSYRDWFFGNPDIKVRTGAKWLPNFDFKSLEGLEAGEYTLDINGFGEWGDE